ncbi:MAG TPA: hypothetical protein VHB25_17315 [Gemmatimonadaceae bacterium]|nr:hypothetical protein [Gemmatimonadaceae bacterium]
MMRLWADSYAKRSTAVTSASLSVAVHVAIIAASVVATLPPSTLPSTGIANRPYYIPPPDRTPGSMPQRETVHYIDLSRFELGIGDGPRVMGDAHPTSVQQGLGRAEADSVTAPALPPSRGRDSVFSVLDVDTAVVRTANSAAPAYPLSMLEKNITGVVSAQYVVDTTGFADSASFTVLAATNQAFVDAVRAALPYMRFTPAKIGAIKVRQLVEQQFTFRISRADTAAPPPRKKP